MAPLARITISSYHLSLALLLASGGLLLWVQGLSNAHWESHFYGTQSATTTSLMVGSAAILGIAGMTSLSAIGFMFNASWSRWGMIAASLFLIWTVPFPLNFMVLMGLIAIVADNPRAPVDAPEP